MKNLKILPICYLIGAIFLVYQILPSNPVEHLHFELDHLGIKSASERMPSLSDDEKRNMTERAYLQSEDYRDYRNYIERHGIGYSETEKERDRSKGGTYDSERGWGPGTVSHRDRD